MPGMTDRGGLEAVVLMATAGARDEAEKLGEGLVEGGLAACVSVVPTIHSMYREGGRLRREHEALLIIKTTTALAEEAMAYVREHHSYQVPEVLRLAVTGGSASYLEWLFGELGEASRPSRPGRAPSTEPAD